MRYKFIELEMNVKCGSIARIIGDKFNNKISILKKGVEFINYIKKTKVKNTTKNICYMGIGIALYFVLGMTLKIPLVGHLKTDLGYIVFGAWCVIFGWKGCIVGAVGCMFESLILNGWFPIEWILGQIVIGIICGIAYQKYNSIVVKIIITIIAIFIGIVGIKTLVACKLYSMPLVAKLIKNTIAAVADVIPMIIGMLLGVKFKNKIKPT